MNSRPRPAAVTSRRDDSRAWVPDGSDSDRPRQTMATTQRHNIDHRVDDGHRRHRTRPVEAQDISSAAPTRSHAKSSSRDRPAAAASSSSHPHASHSQNQATAGGATHPRTQDTYGDPYGLRTYIKRRTDKQSPRSSNEKMPSAEEGRAPRSNPQSRSAYATTTAATVQAPSSTQTYWISAPTTRDPPSVRVHTERDKDREKEKTRSKADRTREKERGRVVEIERQAEREKEKERERRKARERDKDRSGSGKDKHKDKDRLKDRDGRKKEDSRANGTASQVQHPVSSNPLGQHHSDDRMLADTKWQGSQAVRSASAAPPELQSHSGAAYTVQANTIGQATASVRPSGNGAYDPPIAPPTVQANWSEREKLPSKAYRSRHDKPYQSGQESGLSSSEQEQPSRDRQRLIGRRHAAREYAGDGHPSGPSGSETERTAARERRKASRARDEVRVGAVHVSGHKPAPAQTGISQFSGTISQDTANARSAQPKPSKDSSANRAIPHTRESPTHRSLGITQLPVAAAFAGQPTALVGHPTQRSTPHIVSIRAGQGPADPQTPSTLPRSFNAAASRPQEALYAERDSPHEMNTRPQAVLYPPQQSSPRSPPHYVAPGGLLPDGATRANPNHATQLGPPQGDYAATPGASQPGENVIRPSSAAPTSQHVSTSQSGQGAQYSVPGQSPPSSDPHRGPTQYSPSYHANASVYRSPAPAPSAQLGYATGPFSVSFAPNGQQQATGQLKKGQEGGLQRSRSPAPTLPHGTIRNPAQDMPSRFPLNEDTPQTASSAYYPPGSATKPYFSPTDKSFPQPSVIAVQSSMAGYPAYVSVQVHDTRDARSLKASTFQPPQQASASPAPPQSTRSHHLKELSVQTAQNGNIGGGHSPGRHGQSNFPYTASSPAGNGSATLTRNRSSNSPRDAQSALRSPGAHNTMPPGSSTPKHSPSGRLHAHRNGSDDTITQSIGHKYSPLNTSQQSLAHHTSATNLQSHVPSRPDTTSTTRPSNVLSGYPEPARYRSPAPSTYPHPQAVSTSYVSPGAIPPSHSQSQPLSHNSQTPTSASRPTLAPTSPPVLPVDYYARSPDADMSYRVQTPTSAQRVPPRTGPSPAPTVNARQYYGSSPSSRAPIPLPSSPPPQPLRTSTYPVTSARRPAAAPVAPAGHSRTASEPQVAQYPGRSPPAPATSASKYNTAPRYGNTLAVPSPDTDGMSTPSSLAPSMSRQQSTAPAQAPGASTSQSAKDKAEAEKEKEPRRKGGIFSFFRPRSSSAKERGPPLTTRPEPRQRQVSQPTVPSTAKPVVPLAPTISNPTPAVSQSYVPTPTTPAPAPAPATPAPASAVPTPGPGSAHVHVRIAAPVPVPASGRRSPSKMFTPFRLLSKRHRTVSAASVEAVDGTVANTLINGAESTRSSTAGRPSPPLRDPMVAAQEWRNKEEAELAGRGTIRRRRPGVVFDIEERVDEDPRPPQRIVRRQQTAEE